MLCDPLSVLFPTDPFLTKLLPVQIPPAFAHMSVYLLLDSSRAIMKPMERRTFLLTPVLTAAAQTGSPEWRNKQSGMAYRRLGRTNLMVSEIASGGDPIRSENWQHLNLALEMGLNYLDMAPAYGRGDCELSYGKLIKGRRDKVFLATKVSGFQNIRNAKYKEIFDSLPADKQAAIVKRAEELRRERFVDKPGYFMEYFPGQRAGIAAPYLANAMMRDYAHKVEASKEFREMIRKSLEGSLQRAGTDVFDILHCPHGATTPEELDIPEIFETFADLRKEGKIRFLGVSTHNDPARILRKAAQSGLYDVVQCAYNVINAGYMDTATAEAADAGVGIVGMKVAMAVATHHKQLQPIPQWRIDKINRIIPGDMKPPMKAYLWALQNPNITAVVSNLWDETHIRENLSLAGRKVELQYA
jgi:aryl-alcohol dehydrogenase-like predicted oxidoreductase